MNIRQLTFLIAVCGFIFGGVSFVKAQNNSGEHYNDAISQSQKAATVFNEIMQAPDKAIPKGIVDKAQCIAVFPSVIKAGFIFGGRGGRGVASCRTATGWSEPAFFKLKGGSFGLQIGAEATDFVLLFMNQNGMNKLLGDKFEIGADASVAAGPVGREAGASTDIKLTAEILSYSRSKGLFAGLELKGVKISTDKADMRAVYGRATSAKQVLNNNVPTDAPKGVETYPNMLGNYSVSKS